MVIAFVTDFQVMMMLRSGDHTPRAAGTDLDDDRVVAGPGTAFTETSLSLLKMRRPFRERCCGINGFVK